MTDQTKSSEELFAFFLEKANTVGMDVELHKTIPMYFENLDVQGAWMLFCRAYMLGIKDGQKEIFRRMK